MMTLTPEAIMNAGRALVPAYPYPSPETIDDIVVKLCKAFSVPFTVESDAKLLWRQHTKPVFERGPR